MIKTLTAALFAGAMASTAGAATLDFVAEAAGNERGVENGTTLDFSGIGVTFNAVDGTNDAFAYFDDLSSGRPAGLGVCGEVTPISKKCVVGNDDNLNGNEVLTLTFDQTVDLGGFSFYNSAHFALPAKEPTATLLWAINGGALETISFADAVATRLNGVNSIQFGFGGTNATQYYISSIATVPLPAGMLLLGTALAGLGLARRK